MAIGSPEKERRIWKGCCGGYAISRGGCCRWCKNEAGTRLKFRRPPDDYWLSTALRALDGYQLGSQPPLDTLETRINTDMVPKRGLEPRRGYPH